MATGRQNDRSAALCRSLEGRQVIPRNQHLDRPSETRSSSDESRASIVRIMVCTDGGVTLKYLWRSASAGGRPLTFV